MRLNAPGVAEGDFFGRTFVALVTLVSIVGLLGKVVFLAFGYKTTHALVAK